jgi:hypothetical protein
VLPPKVATGLSETTPIDRSVYNPILIKGIWETLFTSIQYNMDKYELFIPIVEKLPWDDIF